MRCKRSAGERKEVFEKCWRNGRRYLRNGGRFEGGVQEVLDVLNDLFKKMWKSGRICSRSVGGVQEVVEE